MYFHPSLWNLICFLVLRGHANRCEKDLVLSVITLSSYCCWTSIVFRSMSTIHANSVEPDLMRCVNTSRGASAMLSVKAHDPLSVAFSACCRSDVQHGGHPAAPQLLQHCSPTRVVGAVRLDWTERHRLIGGQRLCVACQQLCYARPCAGIRKCSPDGLCLFIRKAGIHGRSGTPSQDPRAHQSGPYGDG